MIEVSIDTASELAGIALSEGGALLAELTWRSRRNHSRELLPAVELLLERHGLTKADIGALFVCTGPGSYAGLRVGLSTAKALSYALDVPIVGVGRLAADAEPLAATNGPAVYAVQVAGRADLAWAAYKREEALVEVQPPALAKRDAFLEMLPKDALVCGELDEALRSELTGRGIHFAQEPAARVVSIVRLAYPRLAAGDIDSSDALVPLYLREPAIGPQPQT